MLSLHAGGTFLSVLATLMLLVLMLSGMCLRCDRKGRLRARGVLRGIV
jgi:hypothetical protein